MTAALSNPAAVEGRLSEIENELARRQGDYEAAAMDWFRVKRDREKSWCEVFIRTEGTVAERKAAADLAVSDVGWEAEGRYEALKGVIRTLDTRAAIGMSLLRAQSRIGA